MQEGGGVSEGVRPVQQGHYKRQRQHETHRAGRGVAVSSYIIHAWGTRGAGLQGRGVLAVVNTRLQLQDTLGVHMAGAARSKLSV
jgi:hypothetical protein